MRSFGLKTRSRDIEFDAPAVMGVINVSPDSFYQVRSGVGAIVDTVAKMIDDGVDMIDLGAEATNPKAVLRESEEEQIAFELDQLLPAIDAIRSRFDVFLSIDTSRAKVMRAVSEAGADMINDQRALTLPGALEAAANSGLAICLMHSFMPKREAGSSSPEALLQHIKSDLKERVDVCMQAGIDRKQLVIDPGFGGGHYGKSMQENFYLLNHLSSLCELGLPVLVGWSRKSMLGDLLAREVPDRLAGSLAAVMAAAERGASIIRVHDVPESVDVCRFWRALFA